MGDRILINDPNIVNRYFVKNPPETAPTTTIEEKNDEAIVSHPVFPNTVQRIDSVTSDFSIRKAYVAVIILCFINLINYMDRYTLAGVLRDVKDFYGLDDKKAGLLQTSFIISYLIMAPIFGYLGDRYNRKIIMACGILFWSATTLFGSFVPSEYFKLFIFSRALVGTGEASYSTIAPTVIADLFTDTARTRMLSLFYFAIPVGSGLGYIVGPQVAQRIGHWYWALRVTPALGVLAVILCLFVLIEPPRGRADGGVVVNKTGVYQDIVEVLKIPSFMWDSLGFTCVTFSVGALAWWVPDFMTYAMQVHGDKPDKSFVSLVFGVITCFAGIFGVVLGSACSQYWRRFNPRADPLICAYSMLFSIPLVYVACLIASSHTTFSWVCIFFGVTLLCMNWVLVADIVLYVVIPQRRSMAEAIQISLSHALGDACSPYIVGCLSDAISNGDKSLVTSFKSQQYALFLPIFILVLGSAFFFVNSFYIVEDKNKCNRLTHGDVSTSASSSLPDFATAQDICE